MRTRMNFALVPGLLCDAELWVHQIRFLAGSADCRVATVSEDHTVGLPQCSPGPARWPVGRWALLWVNIVAE